MELHPKKEPKKFEGRDDEMAWMMCMAAAIVHGHDAASAVKLADTCLEERNKRISPDARR